MGGVDQAGLCLSSVSILIKGEGVVQHSPFGAPDNGSPQAAAVWKRQSPARTQRAINKALVSGQTWNHRRIRWQPSATVPVASRNTGQENEGRSGAVTSIIFDTS